MERKRPSIQKLLIWAQTMYKALCCVILHTIAYIMFNKIYVTAEKTKTHRIYLTYLRIIASYGAELRLWTKSPWPPVHRFSMTKTFISPCQWNTLLTTSKASERQRFSKACRMPVHRSSSTGGHTPFVCRIQTTFKGSGEKSKKKTTIQDRVAY